MDPKLLADKAHHRAIVNRSIEGADSGKQGDPASSPLAQGYNMNSFDNDELTLPKATLTQMIKDYLPESVRMSQQSSELIIQLSMHFLNYLSDTSNNVCNAEGKKTITPAHVVRALQTLKMQGYLAKILELDIDGGDGGKGSSNEEDQVSVSALVPAAGARVGAKRGRGGGSRNGDEMLGGLTANETKKMIAQKLDKFGKKKRRKLGGQNCGPPNGMTEEEMIAEQQRLFQNAKDYNYSDDGGNLNDQNNENQDEDDQYTNNQYYQSPFAYAMPQQPMTDPHQAMHHHHNAQYFMHPHAQSPYPFMPQQAPDYPPYHHPQGVVGQTMMPGTMLGYSHSLPAASHMMIPGGPQLQHTASLQLQKTRSCKEVDEINFDEEEEEEEVPATTNGVEQEKSQEVSQTNGQ